MAKGFVVISLIVCFLFPCAALGNDSSRFEISGVYSLLRAAKVESSAIFNPYNSYNISVTGNNRNVLSGYRFGFVINLHRNIGIVTELGWNNSRTSPLKTSINNLGDNSYCTPVTNCVQGLLLSFQLENYGRRESAAFLAGPRYHVNLSKRLRPFAQLLVGLGDNSISMYHSYGVLESHGKWKAGTSISAEKSRISSMVISAGGGLDIKLNKRLSIRLFELEIVNAKEGDLWIGANTKIRQNDVAPPNILQISDRVSGSLDQKQWGNNMRFSFGAVFHFGKKL